MSMPDAFCYMRNLECESSISFGNALQSSRNGMKNKYQPSILASMRANFHSSSSTVSDKEPMYVHLPQFWDAGSRSLTDTPQAISPNEVSSVVAAKETGTLAASSGLDTEVKSECSTADTADRSPGSPELEQACPRNMQRSQHLVVTEFGQSELDGELKTTTGQPWHPRPGNRAVETNNSDAQQGILPSIGSAVHRLGRCKPCAFVGTKGCTSGMDCRFCHVCEAGEKKRRQKEKRAHFTAIRHARHAQNPEANVQAISQANPVSEN